MTYMKKLLLTAFSAASAVASALAANLPYYTDMGSKAVKDIDPDWTIINETEGSKTWVYDSDDNNITKPTEAPCGIKYVYDSKNNADDWAVSPEFALVPGTEYKVSFWMKTSSDTEDLTVYLTQSTDPEQMRQSMVIHDFVEFKNSTYAKYVYTFNVAEAGNYRVAFYLHSPKNHYNVFMRAFSLGENVQYASRVTDLTATASEEQALTVDLTWTLPTTDTDGGDLTAALDNVVVMRDGETIATLPGDATSFADDADKGLTSGFHTYSVYVVYQGRNSNAASVTTSYVGPVVPFTLPFADDFENDELWPLWTVVDVAGDGTAGNPDNATWSRWRNSVLTGYILAFANPSTPVVEDDWVFTPPLNLDAAGQYTLSFDACMYSFYDSSCLLDIFLTQEAAVPAETAEPFATYETFATATYPKDGERVSVEFTVSEPGKYYIGLHEHAATMTARQVRIDNLQVVANPGTGVENIAGETSYTFRDGMLTFAEAAMTQVYSVSGTAVYSGIASTVDFTSIAAGIYIVRHGDMTVKIMNR